MPSNEPVSTLHKNRVPLVFVHGSFANGNSWRKIISHLKDGNICLTLDLPGHGPMDDPIDFSNPTFGPEFEAIKKAISNVCDINNGIHLIGHSYGGVVALAAALKGEFKIEKMTLFEPVAASVLSTFEYVEELNSIASFTEKYQISYDNGEKIVCARVIDFWGGPGSFEMIPTHIQNAMAEMTKNNLRHWDLCMNEIFKISDYNSLDIPITLVLGSNSNSIAKLICKTLNKNLPNSSLQTIDNASHFMITTHVEECVKILKA